MASIENDRSSSAQKGEILEPVIRALEGEMTLRKCSTAGRPQVFLGERGLEGECAGGRFRIFLHAYSGYEIGQAATYPELSAPTDRAPATLSQPETGIELLLARPSPYPVSLRARSQWTPRPKGFFGRLLERLGGGEVWSTAGAIPVWASDRKALALREQEEFERHGLPFETGDARFDVLVVAHSGRVEETRARLLREEVRARCIEMVRHNEPYKIALRFTGDAIVWRTDLTDRTPPAMIRALLEDLARLQGLLFD